ncbi:MAG: hypothetical protein HRF43_16980 [Phycisphaerae bacterium]
MNTRCVVLLATGVAVGAARPLLAQAPASRPASAPAVALDPAVERILDRLEAKGREIKDIECRIVYLKEDPIFNGEERFEGVLLFKEDKPNPLFHIRFDRSVANGRPSDKKEWHVFDGQWYTEAREKTLTKIKHQVLRPGENRQLFRLGQGPFPLPFGQTKADIVKHLSVRLIPPDPKAPKTLADTDHLECTPLPGTELDRKYETIHFWIDRALAMPRRVQTVEKEQGDKITADFSDARTNTGIAGSRLSLPELKDYAESVEPLPPP